ncbi:MAG: hypothetical protein IJ088_03760 [Clostridia bacterium]|nr:hypothetical protein [Clostridia bacterium]
MILLSKEDMWLNTSALERIGNSSHILIFTTEDGSLLMIASTDASNPDATEISGTLIDGLPSDCQEWVGLETPQAYARWLPDDRYLLELHGVQMNPGVLIFDVGDGILCTYNEVFGTIRHVIVPPGWSFSEAEFARQASENAAKERLS